MPPVLLKIKAAAILATVLLLDDLEEERIKKKGSGARIGL
jgi:hypothetical protein